MKTHIFTNYELALGKDLNSARLQSSHVSAFDIYVLPSGLHISLYSRCMAAAMISQLGLSCLLNVYWTEHSASSQQVH